MTTAPSTAGSSGWSRRTSSRSAGSSTATPAPPSRDGNSTLVEFSLSPEGDATRLTVVESGFRDLSGSEDENQGHVDSHRRGWKLELGELREYAEKRMRAGR